MGKSSENSFFFRLSGQININANFRCVGICCECRLVCMNNKKKVKRKKTTITRVICILKRVKTENWIINQVINYLKAKFLFFVFRVFGNENFGICTKQRCGMKSFKLWKIK